ncbi:MAG: hypothetical protein IPG16_03285 [Comamonadaceae bacterium]|nr:hypothetical protein [Comamonadaceae bacterium]
MASNPLTNIQRLTESGLARQLGVSRQAVHELVKRGVLSKDKDGLIDFELAKHALMNRVRPSGKTAASLQEPATPPTTQTPETSTEPEITSDMQAKTAREVYEAKTAQLEYEERTGKLIQVSAVRATWATRIASARDALLQIPARIAPVLAAETNLAAVTLLLESELRQALAELSREDAGT